MGDGEVICLSSEDETETPKKEHGKVKELMLKEEAADELLIQVIEEAQDKSKENGKPESSSRKRKLPEIDEDISEISEKIVKLSSPNEEREIPKITIEEDPSEPDTLYIETQETFQKVERPKLVIKEKISICSDEQDPFAMFLDACFKKDSSNDMKYIINKLKKHYKRLDPTFASSAYFISVLDEAKAKISNTESLYAKIWEVLEEIRKNEKSFFPYIARGELEDENTEEKLRLILNVMEKCRKRVKQLEESETDFDHDSESTYIQLQAYRKRIVELYTKYCELLGENVDAGRAYLRPKHFSATGIVAVDQALTAFINSKIVSKKKRKKIGGFTDTLIFPDHKDILDCVTKCNTMHELGLSDKKLQSIAKKAFIEIGEHLQRVRREDYWDTFSIDLEEADDDPALKDQTLAEKLLQNKKEGEKRLANVFQEYVKKQEEIKEDIVEDDDAVTSQDETDEEDDSENEEDPDDTDDTEILIQDEKPVSDNNMPNNDEPNQGDNQDIECIDKNTCSQDNTEMVVVDLLETDNSSITINDNSQTETKDNTDKNPVPLKETEEIVKSISQPNPEVSCTVKINETEENTPVACNKSTNETMPEDEKPTLRVCAFAKPPSNWEDERQQQEPLVRDAEVPSVLKSRLENRQKSTDDTCSPAKVRTGQASAPMKKVLLISDGSKIIHIAPVVAVNQKNANDGIKMKCST